MLTNKMTLSDEKMLQKLVSMIDDETLNFIKAKEEYKKALTIPAFIYSDLSRFPSTSPYFHLSDDWRLQQQLALHHPSGAHLVVCVHGLDGNSADLRLVKTYLEMALPGVHLDFLMSEVNQGDTFSTFEAMTERLVDEILQHLARNYSGSGCLPNRISFVGHSLGCILIRSAVAQPKMAHLVQRFYTYLGLSGPHLGSLYNNSGLVNMGKSQVQ